MRGSLALGAAALAAGLVVAFAPLFRPGAVLPTAVACGTLAAMAVLPTEVRQGLGWVLVVPGAVSLASTAVVLANDSGTNTPATGTTVEVAALLLLLIHVTRWGTGWSLVVVTVVTASAQVLWLLRYMPGAPWPTQVAGCAFWALGSAVAIVFGAYPRWAAGRLRRSVASAREAQQRQLERDLHDYVAHDLSGMIVQAQAARYAAAGDPAALAAALQRIEDAGHRAMSSMDRALSLLRTHEPDGEAVPPRQPGIDELPELVRRFEAASGTRATVHVQGNPAVVPREVGEVLYRSASEALTNVRRHAGTTATAVDVTLDVRPGAARLTVVDEGRGRRTTPAPRHGGGTGIARLAERVEPLDGVLEAGPTDTGWRLAVQVPFTGAAT